MTGIEQETTTTRTGTWYVVKTSRKNARFGVSTAEKCPCVTRGASK